MTIAVDLHAKLHACGRNMFAMRTDPSKALKKARQFFIVFDRFFLVMADRGNAGPAAHISFVVLCKPTTDVQWNWDASVYPQLYSMQSVS